MKFCAKAISALALIVSIWVMPSRLTASNIRQVANLSSQCDSGKEKACRELAKIAVEDKDANVRRAAVAKVTDQSLLAKIVLEDSNVGVRSAAVINLTDQALLAKVALEGTDASARRTTVSKLSDQTLLARIAQEDQDAAVRRAAVAKLTDQSVLSKSALQDKDAGVRGSAMSKLTDQALLAKVAIETTDATARRTAMSKLTDRSVLARIVGQDIKDIRLQVSNDAVTFAPTVTFTVKDGWVDPSSWQQSPGRTVVPKDFQSFLAVEIVFEPKVPIELAASDVRLVVPYGQNGALEAFGLLGNPAFQHSVFQQDAQGRTVSAQTSAPSWEDPKGQNNQKIAISGRRTLSWLFLVARDGDARQYELLISGAEFSLASSQK